MRALTPEEWAQGSPPHTRGRCFLGFPKWAFWGFTPAYAGKMPVGLFLSRDPGVHPRIRGEDVGKDETAFSCSGSPPHTRGRFKAGPVLKLGLRFTPAYAGKIGNSPSRPGLRRVHPRIRGEDLNICARASSHGGSPPHTRGRFRYSGRICRPVWFTPAYAGKITSR